jgi:anti-sigma regulatory factor (Ser/Thr protein kinase)
MMAAPSQGGRAGRQPVLEIDLERTARAPALARAAINGFCQEQEFSPSTIATLTLLVSEVVTNAVIHPDVKDSAPITVHAHLEKDAVHIEVRDTGTRFTPQPRNPDRIDGGYGLYLVEKVAKGWGLRPGPTTTVWFQVARATQ